MNYVNDLSVNNQLFVQNDVSFNSNLFAQKAALLALKDFTFTRESKENNDIAKNLFLIYLIPSNTSFFAQFQQNKFPLIQPSSIFS